MQNKQYDYIVDFFSKKIFMKRKTRNPKTTITSNENVDVEIQDFFFEYLFCFSVRKSETNKQTNNQYSMNVLEILSTTTYQSCLTIFYLFCFFFS